jgi:hypothetical protein
VQQAFGGMARVVAPIWATEAYQTLGHSTPFYISGLIVALVGLLTLRVRATPRPVAESA